MLFKGEKNEVTFEVESDGEMMKNLTLCFKEEATSTNEEALALTLSITSGTKKLNLKLVKGSSTNNCIKKLDPGKKMIGMLIFGAGISTVLFVVGYMIRNQLQVCADPRRNL